jgi:ribosomal protein S18 acetylase RimI-like enzyme
MLLKSEVDTIVKGVELSWTTWGKMRGERLILDDISYVKSENDKGFERIFSVNIEKNQKFRVQQMISLIKAGILPDSMLIMPNTKPENLAEILSARGFVINDSDPCMVLYLEKYESINQEYTGFEIKKITEKNQLADWLNIVSIALFECDLVTLEQFSDILELGNTYFYLGLVDGKPVTACMTITEGDTSVLEMVATLKEYRRKGFASAVIDRALKDLWQAEIKTVSLRAEADGVGVYKKLGFKQCFKRIVATCDWKIIYKKACPCRMENEKNEKAKQIFNETNSIEKFVFEMKRQGVIGRDICFESRENAIYITKMYANDCGGGCPSNNTLIGQRCHCEYINHLTENIPISYCRCAAFWFETMFCQLFGNSIQIEPVKTVLSGGDECLFRIKL